MQDEDRARALALVGDLVLKRVVKHPRRALLPRACGLRADAELGALAAVEAEGDGDALIRRPRVRPNVRAGREQREEAAFVAVGIRPAIPSRRRSYRSRRGRVRRDRPL